MKLINYVSVVLLCMTIASCSVDHTDEDLTITQSEKQDLNNLFQRYLDEEARQEEEEEPCLSVNLIAGQNHIAGKVTVDIVEGNFVITYITNEDWLIYGTHLSINNCEDDNFPTTGSGNPKVGHFEYSTDNESGTTEVIYTVDATDFEDRFCFAAHANVTGPTGDESAWAEGDGFPGKNWAMFVEGSVLDCDTEEPDDDDPKK